MRVTREYLTGFDVPEYLNGPEWRERFEYDYSEEAFGDGSSPELETEIVLDFHAGNGLLPGKAYPVFSHRAWVYIILDERGHERALGMTSGTHAHCNGYDPAAPPRARVFERIEKKA